MLGEAQGSGCCRKYAPRGGGRAGNLRLGQNHTHLFSMNASPDHIPYRGEEGANGGHVSDGVVDLGITMAANVREETSQRYC